MPYISFAGFIFVLYFKKMRKLNRISKMTQELNNMLFRAICAQLLIIQFILVVPLLFIFGMQTFSAFVPKMLANYDNFRAQIAILVISTYPIFDVFTMIYFIKPYRRFVMDGYKKIVWLITRNKHATVGNIRISVIQSDSIRIKRNGSLYI